MFRNFKKIHILIIFTTLLTVLVQSNMVFATEISNIRFGFPKQGIYRIVIETTEQPNYKAFTITSPERLVVDIKRAISVNKNFPIIKDMPISDYRIGHPENNITRIVFDLKKTLEISRHFLLNKNANNDYRIVIDLKNKKLLTKPSRPIQISNNLDKYSKINSVILAYERYKKNKKPKNISELIASKNITSTHPKPAKKIHHKKYKPKYNSLNSNNIYKIAIDAGHGGKDPGASSGRIKEKHITLALARALKEELLKTKRYKVVMTRNSDRFIKLRQRVNIARRAGADLFISIHADKIKRKNVRGTSIYTLSEKASDKESAKLAQRENEADIIAGVDLSHEDEDVADILIDLAIRDTMNNSNVLANTILASFRKNNLKLLRTAHRSAGFAVLKAPDIPSVLIEAGFISNRKEARLLTSREHQRKIARAIRHSIDAYFRKLEATNPH